MLYWGFMITIIFGPPRAGKTSLMTHFAVEHITALAQEDIFNCKAVIKKLNKGGFNLSILKRHLVFSDYQIVGRQDGIKPRLSYDIDGFFIGLPNSQHPVIFFPPYSQIYLDEAQKYYNSRMNPYLADFVSRFYETHAHNFLNITMVCQRPGLIDLNIREIAGRFIEIIDLKHRYDRDGIIKESIWTCIEFDNYFDLNNYLSSDKRNNFGHLTKYVHEGNIFSCYNSFQFFGLHYKDCYDRDFSMVESLPSGFNLALIQALNERHGFEVPPTFYKQPVGKQSADKKEKRM